MLGGGENTHFRIFVRRHKRRLHLQRTRGCWWGWGGWWLLGGGSRLGRMLAGNRQGSARGRLPLGFSEQLGQGGRLWSSGCWWEDAEFRQEWNSAIFHILKSLIGIILISWLHCVRLSSVWMKAGLFKSLPCLGEEVLHPDQLTWNTTAIDLLKRDAQG